MTSCLVGVVLLRLGVLITMTVDSSHDACRNPGLLRTYLLALLTMLAMFVS